MTQPLDPWTLRQAAARWPNETLSKSAAQSFLRSLADEVMAERQQPATGVTFMGESLDPLLVPLIRALNGAYTKGWTDLELVQTFGEAARPLAEGLRAAIAGELQRYLNGEQP